MWVPLHGFNIINGIFSTMLVIITALVGLYWALKANRAARIEVIDDLSTIARTREEANEVLQERIDSLSRDLDELKSQVVHLESINTYLLSSKLAWRRYGEHLERLAREKGLDVPPRPAEA